MHTVIVYHYMIFIIYCHTWCMIRLYFYILMYLLLGILDILHKFHRWWNVEIKSGNRAVNPAQPNRNRMGSRIIGLVPSRGKSRDFPHFDQAASVWVPSAMPAGYSTCPEYIEYTRQMTQRHIPSTPPPNLPISSPTSTLLPHGMRSLKACHVGFHTGFYRVIGSIHTALLYL